ncbi:MAG TPA: MlaD family protein [Haliangium sp.]|nr:MlaD family protein [Haliangium sp.]
MLAVHDERLTLRVGTVVLAALLGVIVLLIGMQRFSLRETLTATVYFEHVGPLREGAEVQVAGRIIGKVLAISLVPARRAGSPDHPLARRDGVAVHIRLQARFAHMAPLNGTYFISAKGVLGERFLEIGAPAQNGPRDRALRAGDELRGVDAPHLDRTLWRSYLSLMIAQSFLSEIAPQVSSLMRVVDELTITLEQLDVGPRARALATSLDELRAQARATLAPWQSGEMTWSDLVAATERAQLTLARTQALVAEIRARAAVATDTLARIDRQIPADLADRVAATLETLERAVARTQKTVATLGELVAMIERGQGTVGALLNDAELFDDAKSLGKMLKNNPWRVVAPPPAEN